MEPLKTAKPRGRPRAFDQDDALEKAMHVFWERGYEGATMADLTTALGINKPSIYGTFGSKEELFRKALQRYLEGPAAFVRAALQEPTSYKVAEKLMTAAADFLTDKHHPPGCMLTLSALACGESATLIRDELAEHRKKFETGLAKRFERAQAEQDLPADAKPAALARLVATVHQGMSVQAASGSSEADLMEVAQQVLKSWPGKRS